MTVWGLSHVTDARRVRGPVKPSHNKERRSAAREDFIDLQTQPHRFYCFIIKTKRLFCLYIK